MGPISGRISNKGDYGFQPKQTYGKEDRFIALKNGKTVSSVNDKIHLNETKWRVNIERSCLRTCLHHFVLGYLDKQFLAIPLDGKAKAEFYENYLPYQNALKMRTFFII